MTKCHKCGVALMQYEVCWKCGAKPTKIKVKLRGMGKEKPRVYYPEVDYE